MKCNNNTKTAIKNFKAVEFMRTLRDKISTYVMDMDFEQIMKYFKERKAKLAGK